MSLAELQALEDSSVIHSYARFPVEFVRGEGARLWDVRWERVPRLPLRHLRHEHRPLPPARGRGRARAGRAADARLEPVLHRAGDAPRRAPVAVEPSAARCSSATPAPRPTRRRSSSPARPVSRGMSCRSTAPSTVAPTARSRRRHRSQSRRRSRRSSQVSVRSIPPPRRSRPRSTVHTAAVFLEPIQGESGVNVLSDETAPRRA